MNSSLLIFPSAYCSYSATRSFTSSVHLALHELRAADHGVNVLVGAFPLPELSLHHADGRFCRGTVDALAFHAVHEMAAEALLTVLVGVRIVQHVVRADQLVVMCREDDLTISSGLLAPLHDFQNDGRCQLVVKIVQVTDIRLEVVQHLPQLYSCFLAVDGLDGVGPDRTAACRCKRCCIIHPTLLPAQTR